MAQKQQLETFFTNERQAWLPGAPGVSVADVLREARERYGEDLQAIAQSLRIRPAYLEAIEAGRFQDLPGPTYAVGFVRSYAEHLGLDSDEIVRRFKEEVQGLERQTALVFPTPAREGKLPGAAVILVSLVLAALAYGGWLFLSNQERSVIDLVPELPETLRALIDNGEAAKPTAAESSETSQSGAAPEAAPTAATAKSDEPAALQTAPKPVAESDLTAQPGSGQTTSSAPAETTVTSEPPAQLAEPSISEIPSPVIGTDNVPPVEEEPALPQPRAEGASEDAQQAEAATATEPASPAPEALAPEASPSAIPAAPASPDLAGTQTAGRGPQVFGLENENARIVLTATADSWVQVRDATEAILLTRVLRPGDSYRVPDQLGLKLFTGNAGGISVEIDGRQLPPLGRFGQVRKEITLEPEALIKEAAAAQ